jgi:hypothetical protein
MPRKLENWLLTYGEYTAGTESPESYHLWAGLATIAAVAQRKIRLQVGRLKFHSNLMVVLVGPSGGPRKTSALDYARSLLKGEMDEVDIESYGQKIELSPEKASGAAVIKRLCSIANKEHQSLNAFLGELGTLFRENDSEMIDTITNFWDCRSHYEKETVGRGVEGASAPWLNILAATTPVWLSDNLGSTAIEGGLVSRGLWVYEAEKIGRRAEPPEPDQHLRLQLVHDLAEVSKLSATFQLSEQARARYIHWYEHELDLEKLPDPRFISHRERKHTNVLKVAMLFALARSDRPVVEEHDFEMALAYVSDLEPGMTQAFQGVGKNIHSMDYERIKAQIRKFGSMHYKDVIKRNVHSINKLQIDEIIVTLVEAGEIRREGQVFHIAA